MAHQRTSKFLNLKVPEGVSEPKGERACLLAAVKRLEPFRRTVVTVEGKEWHLSREFAEEILEGIARRFNTNEYLERTAPRFSGQMVLVGELQSNAAALADSISKLDDFTRADLHRCGLEISYLLSLMKAAKHLARLASAAEAELKKSRKLQGRSVEDRGGNTNLYKEHCGTPRWRLVTDLLFVYEQFKPQQATATEGGDFHLFALDVFEFAAGKEGNEYGRLEPLIKKLVKPTRREYRITKELQLLSKKQEKLLSERNNGDNGKRVIAFMKISVAKFKKLEELREVTELTWPHVRLPAL